MEMSLRLPVYAAPDYMDADQDRSLERLRWPEQDEIQQVALLLEDPQYNRESLADERVRFPRMSGSGEVEVAQFAVHVSVLPDEIELSLLGELGFQVNRYGTYRPTMPESGRGC